MLIDTHAHIDMDNYRDNLDEILENAKDNDVEKIIIPAVEPKTFQGIIDIIEKYDNVYGSVGIHPSDAKEYKDELYPLMLNLAKHPKVVAIGEIGLDYYWDKTFNDLQKEVFGKQINLAKEVNKPVIVHNREAHKDTFDILRKTNAKELGVIMHCFSGSPEFALECVQEGFYIALGGVVTFKNAKKMKEVAKLVPLGHLLLETDSPYLAPEPYRGKENQPAYVKYVAQEIANLRGISFEEVARQTTTNALRVFKI